TEWAETAENSATRPAAAAPAGAAAWCRSGGAASGPRRRVVRLRLSASLVELPPTPCRPGPTCDMSRRGPHGRQVCAQGRHVAVTDVRRCSEQPHLLQQLNGRLAGAVLAQIKRAFRRCQFGKGLQIRMRLGSLVQWILRTHVGENLLTFLAGGKSDDLLRAFLAVR